MIGAESGSGIARVRVSTYPLTVEASTDETGRYMLTSGSFEQEIDYRLDAAHGSYIGFLSKAFRLAPGEELDLLDVPLRPQTAQIDTVRAGEPDYSTKDTGFVVPGTW